MEIAKILIIGGCTTDTSSAITAGLAAKNTGSTDVSVYTAKQSKEQTSLSLYEFTGHTGSLGLHDVKIIQNMNPDVIVIGNGLGNDFDAKKASLAIINTEKIVVICGDAVVPELSKIYNKNKHRWIILCDNYTSNGCAEAIFCTRRENSFLVRRNEQTAEVEFSSNTNSLENILSGIIASYVIGSVDVFSSVIRAVEYLKASTNL